MKKYCYLYPCTTEDTCHWRSKVGEDCSSLPLLHFALMTTGAFSQNGKLFSKLKLVTDNFFLFMQEPTEKPLNGSDYAGHPNESLARESVYSRLITGCKSRVKVRIYMVSHKPNTVGEICCPQLLVYTYAQFCFR